MRFHLHFFLNEQSRTKYPPAPDAHIDSDLSKAQELQHVWWHPAMRNPENPGFVTSGALVTGIARA